MNRHLTSDLGYRLDVVLLLCVSLTLYSCSRGNEDGASTLSTVVVFKHGKLSGDPRTFEALLREAGFKGRPGKRVTISVVGACPHLFDLRTGHRLQA